MPKSNKIYDVENKEWNVIHKEKIEPLPIMVADNDNPLLSHSPLLLIKIMKNLDTSLQKVVDASEYLVKNILEWRLEKKEEILGVRVIIIEKEEYWLLVLLLIII